MRDAIDFDQIASEHKQFCHCFSPILSALIKVDNGWVGKLVLIFDVKLVIVGKVPMQGRFLIDWVRLLAVGVDVAVFTDLFYLFPASSQIEEADMELLLSIDFGGVCL